MTAQILDGRALAQTLRGELRDAAASLAAARGRPAALAVVQVAGDPSAVQYLRAIQKLAAELGVVCRAVALPADASQTALETALADASADGDIDGVMLHLPLPPQLDSAAAIANIDPAKDVDGVHPVSAGRLAQGLATFVPNTPAGGMELLRRGGVELAGRRAVVVGRSSVVGRPMALLLLHANATVTIAHSRTPDLAAVVREADIVAAAAGRAGLITGAMIKPGAAVIDFGINVGDDGKARGDVDFDSAAAVAGAISPVPGGTGPLTNIMLMRNLLRAADWGALSRIPPAG